MSAFTDKLASGTLWAGLGRGVAMVCSFMMTLLLARALSPAEYGAYFVAVSTIVILATVGTVGMDQVVVRFAAAYHGADMGGGMMRRVMLICLAVVIVGSIAATALLASGGEYFFSSVVSMPIIRPVLWIVALWLFFATIQRQLAESFRGVNDIRLATLFGGVRSNGILNSVVACLAIACLWALGWLDLQAALLIALGASVLVVLSAQVSFWRLIRRHPVESKNMRAGRPLEFSLARALHEGWPLWFAVLLNVLNAMGSAWLAGAFDTPGHVALFGIAQRVVLLLIAPMQIVNAVLPPLVARFHSAQDMTSAGRLVRMAAGVVLFPSMIVFAILLLVGKPLLATVFGEFYAGSYPLFLALGIGQLVNLATGAWQVVMPMTGSRIQMLFVSIFAIVLQASVGIFLGSHYGVMGVAVAFTVAMTVTNVLGMCLVRVHLGVWTIATLNRQSIRVVNGYLRLAFSRMMAGGRREFQTKA